MLKSLKQQHSLVRELLSKVHLLSLFFILSCAKMTYVTQQGWGQLKIQWSGVDYEEVLKDPKVDEKTKDKIRKIQTYKAYFYEYFKKEPTSIYSEVTFLETEAVTHLVIASLYNKVEAHREWFPFFGEFPYLGFFNKDSAASYAKKMERNQYFTYIRPVYAYSSLGNFEDKILSSFFQYGDRELAELIFHELFHTVFFIKNDVDFNENLANYFGKKLVLEYFKVGPKEEEKQNKRERKVKGLRSALVREIDLYKKYLKKENPKDKVASELLLKNYLHSHFFPQIKKSCQELKIEDKHCYPLKGNWNNARFSAYMTYEKKMSYIEKIQNEKKLSLIKLFELLEEKKKVYSDLNIDQKFSEWLETNS